MNWNPIVGLVAVLYGLLVIYIGWKKPDKMWNMKKIQAFVKALGEKGTVIFFVIFGLIAIGVGLWLFIANPIG